MPKKVPDFAKLHAKEFGKMDSLDVYLSKKKDRSIKKVRHDNHELDFLMNLTAYLRCIQYPMSCSGHLNKLTCSEDQPTVEFIRKYDNS